MTLKLRNLRLFPFLLLICLILLFALDLRERGASGTFQRNGAAATPLPAAESPVPGPVLLEFSGIILDAAQPGWPAADRFDLSPDKRGQRIACRVRYRFRESIRSPLLFIWYRGNERFQSDTLSPPAAEGMLSSLIDVPRDLAGHWSVDLLLADGTLLRTLDFQVRALETAPTVYKSEIRNKEP